MRKVGFAVMLCVGVMLGGCEEVAAPPEPTGAPEQSAVTPATAPSLGRFAIQGGAELVSAHLEIYVSGIEVPSQVRVYRVTAPWTECEPTWQTHSTRYDPTPIATFTPAGIGYVSVDVTSLVKTWKAGTCENYGMMLRQQLVSDNHNTEYYSSEHAGMRLRLVLVVKVDGINKTVVIERGVRGTVNDTWIWSLGQNLSGCDTELLYTRANAVYRKDVLLGFSLDGACTRTPGYWKTHSEFGPSSYDATWALLPAGARTVFFLSGRNYHQVLWTPPQGNAYYILAHPYIAAKLNVLKGTPSTPEVSAVPAWSEQFFSTKTPSSILTRALRGSVIANAKTLDDYNNGLTGPGHCE